MKKYENIIFDLDGTLLNTIDDLTDSVNYVCKKYGYDVYSVEQIKSFVGNGIRKLLERAIPKGSENERFEECYEDFRKYYTRNCMNKTCPYDGIKILLAIMNNRGYNMAIVSNKNDTAVKKLNKSFFDGYVGVAIGQGEHTNKKPAPDTVYEAMRQMPKGRTLYVGDSEVDKMTADNAGVDCILVSWGFRERCKLLELQPLKVIDYPEELLQFI